MEVCESCNLAPCGCPTCPVCNEKYPKSEGNGCYECCCDDCGKPLTTEEEKENGVCTPCWDKSGEQIHRDEAEAYRRGLCQMCFPDKESRATTTYFMHGGEMPVCQDCFNDQNEVEAVSTEFVVEHGRQPSLREVLEAGNVFGDDDDI